MRILIVPDSFKGTLTSQQVCDCIEAGLNTYNGNEIIKLPFADGGEGFALCMANICKADTLYINCTDIYGRHIKAPIYVYDKTAIIECAAASGLQRKRDVMNATSYGTGELIKAALLKGFSNIILGLGGSGTTDGGAGALTALGVHFKDMEYNDIDYPTGKDLCNIYGASFTNTVKGINLTYACDVENEFYGRNGAAYVFAPQKGATEEQVKELDNGLKMLNAFLPRDVSSVKGAGAAGGLCGGLYSVFGGEIKSGFDILAEAYKLESEIEKADLVITGEGKTDAQSLMGKLPSKICALSKKHGKPCYVISGSIDNVKLGDKMLSLVDDTTTLDEAMSNPEGVLTEKAKLLLQ